MKTTRLRFADHHSGEDRGGATSVFVDWDGKEATWYVHGSDEDGQNEAVLYCGPDFDRVKGSFRAWTGVKLKNVPLSPAVLALVEKYGCERQQWTGDQWIEHLWPKKWVVRLPKTEMEYYRFLRVERIVYRCQLKTTRNPLLRSYLSDLIDKLDGVIAVYGTKGRWVR